MPKLPRQRRERDVWLPTLPPRPRKQRLRDSTAPPRPRRQTKPRPEEPADDDPEHRTVWPLDPYNEDSGVFYFRGALLERLDSYFRAIARMRRADNDAYGLYARIGSAVVPHKALGSAWHLPAIWRDPDKRPAFGCVSFASSKEEEGEEEPNCLQMVYFQKMDRLMYNVEPANGDIYRITAYWDDLSPTAEANRRAYRAPKWLRKRGFTASYHVAIDGDCNVRPLRELQQKGHPITYRAGVRRGGKTRLVKMAESIPYQTWDYPESLRWWFEDRKDKKGEPTIDLWGAATMNLIACFSHDIELGTRVQVTDPENNSCVFCVDVKRTSYFFKDRDTVLTEKGHKARIFHVVRPHRRALAGGKELFVKMHFRGLRRFKWGRYQVLVTVPGLHHVPISDFNIGVTDEALFKPEELAGTVRPAIVGEALRQHLDGRDLRGAFEAIRSGPNETGTDRNRRALGR